MLYIQKGEEPEFLTEFKRKNPAKQYDSKEFKSWIPILRDVLCNEQKGLCAYCCSKISVDKSHNEHIEPRNPGTYTSKRSLDYTNIVASCQNKNTCGNKKGNDYDEEKFISPLDDHCEDKFSYFANGEIVGDEYTINLLGLNHYDLKSARQAVYKMLQGMDKETIAMVYMDENDVRMPYYDVIKWYYMHCC